VPGVLVGHAQDLNGLTGCTAIICPENTIGGVDQRGGAPGTRETDLLHPMRIVQTVDAILLSGGSAFGLAAADGVMRWLEEQGRGYQTTVARVPIVPAAILFDLDVGSPRVRPNADMGYMACQTASSRAVYQGCVGAGTGAKIGSIMGIMRATKGGIGSASVHLGEGLVVAALIAVNTVGDVVDEQGKIMAGLRNSPDSREFTGTLNFLRELAAAQIKTPITGGTNTAIGVVATNAKLDKEDTNKVAQMAHDGLAQAVRPAHTPFDGDTIFSLSTGELPANVGVIGAFAAEVVAEAVRNAARAAIMLGGIPAMRDLQS
jgi:L-aminopeptidase/D-esterase-like protein